MASVPTPVDVGFAEFVSLLLSETLESVLAAQTGQEEQRRALIEAASLTVEEFADGFVTETDVELFLAELLPGEKGGTSAVVGGPAPSPEVLESLAIELEANDVRDRKLTRRGAARIREAVRVVVAERRLDALQASAQRGIPRVIVDEGRIVAKLTFSAVTLTEEEDDQPRPSSRPTTTVGRAGLVDVARLRATPTAGVAQPLGSISTGHLARALPAAIRDIRLIVKPATTEEATSTRAEVYGEVELRFQTIF